MKERGPQPGLPPAEQDLQLQYLLARLARINLLVQRGVLLWQAAGQDPNDNFRGLYISDTEALALSGRAPLSHWGQNGALQPGDQQAFTEAMERAEQRCISLASTIRAQGAAPRLEALAQNFALEPFDVDVLLICLAPALEQRYERLYGYLQDDVTRKRPTVNLALDLLCGPGLERLQYLERFLPPAPLARYSLIESAENSSPAVPLLSRPLAIDETLLHWLLGSYHPTPDYQPALTLTAPQFNPEDELLAGEAWLWLAAALESGNPLLAFSGIDEAGQAAAARLAAVHLGSPLLSFDLSAVLPDLAARPALEHALRDARLAGAVPFVYNWDAAWENGVPQANLLEELLAFPGPLIVASSLPWQMRGVSRQRACYAWEFQAPGFQNRQALWNHFLSGISLETSHVAGEFKLTPGQIRDAVATARDRARLNGTPLHESDLLAAARAHSNPNLASLARKINPRFTWEDLILPADQVTQLAEIISTARERPVVLDAWGVGQKLASSQGITVLFAGPPGTGKTMSAEVIAGELGLDLYKIDLSTVVSKYIGETEKNLERIFLEAATSNAILFFDEADAIFGKRSEVRDAHDRYANIEISYLLQRMETYDGITILATNLRANLDEAFTRRLQFAVDFPFPDESHRLRIWQALFPPGVPRAPDLDFPRLAQRFKLSGGNIRNIIVGASYLAAADGGQVTMEHLLHSARRELQKMGKLVMED